MGTLSSDIADLAAFPQREFMEIGGVRTAVHRGGAGPETIFFIYGGEFGTKDSAGCATTWASQFSALSNRYRMVTFDKVGQGYTEPPLRDEDYKMSTVVAHAIAAIEALADGPVHVVGHSRGGFAATRIALERPDLIRSLTIVSSSTLSPGVGANEVALARPPFAPGSRDNIRWVYETYCFSPDTVNDSWIEASESVLSQDSFQRGVRKINDEQLGLSQYIPDLARYKRETLAWLAEGRLQRPTQIVCGANDRTLTIDRAYRLYDTIATFERRATFQVVNQCGHFVFKEHTERFNAWLSSFVDLYSAERIA